MVGGGVEPGDHLGVSFTQARMSIKEITISMENQGIQAGPGRAVAAEDGGSHERISLLSPARSTAASRDQRNRSVPACAF